MTGSTKGSAIEAASARVGEVLAAKYRLVRLIARGGMGAVYEAQHVVVGRRFAIKCLHPEMVEKPDLLERFRREARAAGSLESENIASIVDFGVADDGVPYIVMELLAGEDLRAFLTREGPLPVPRAVGIVTQTCRGLEAAHAAGIIHRDLKPENLFLCKRSDGTDLVKILDFGIAKLGGDSTDPSLPSVTRTGSTLGTPFYMSPEQARGDKELDQRTDVYALGVILFEVLSGAKPHFGDSYNSIMYHILTQPVADLDKLRPGLPAGLTGAIKRALAFQPGDRQQSAKDLARELAPFAGRAPAQDESQFQLRPARDVATRPPRDDGPPMSAGDGGRTISSSATLAPARPPARRRAIGLAVAAVVVVAAVAGWVAWQRSEAPPPPSRGETSSGAQQPAAAGAPAAAAPVETAPPAAAATPAPPPVPPPAAVPAPAAAEAPAVTGAEAPPPPMRQLLKRRRMVKTTTGVVPGVKFPAGPRSAAVPPAPAPAPAAPAAPAAPEPAAGPPAKWPATGETQPARRRPTFDRSNPYQ